MTLIESLKIHKKQIPGGGVGKGADGAGGIVMSEKIKQIALQVAKSRNLSVSSRERTLHSRQQSNGGG